MLARRQPRQLRARQTFDAILEAAIRVLRREGIEAVTTNRIAEVAGVSIGSLYQYFPDRSAIFAALHRRHIEEVDRVVESTLTQNATAPLEYLMRAMVDALVDCHSVDPELHDALLSQVPDRAGGTKDFAERLDGAILLALSSRSREIRRNRDLARQTFVVTHMVESLCHGAARHPPSNSSMAQIKAEIVRAVMGYLRS